MCAFVPAAARRTAGVAATTTSAMSAALAKCDQRTGSSRRFRPLRIQRQPPPLPDPPAQRQHQDPRNQPHPEQVLRTCHQQITERQGLQSDRELEGLHEQDTKGQAAGQHRVEPSLPPAVAITPGCGGMAADSGSEQEWRERQGARSRPQEPAAFQGQWAGA